MEEAQERQARLKALREKAQAEGAGALAEGGGEEGSAPELKFRNYRPRDGKLKGEAVPVAHPAEVPDPVVELRPDQLASIDAVVATAPKKPHWDLKRDVEKRMEKLDRRTQR